MTRPPYPSPLSGQDCRRRRFRKGPRRRCALPSSRASEFKRKSKGSRAPCRGLRFRKPQRPLFVGREIDAGRNDIDALAFDRHSVGRQQDRHRRVAREQIHHHAIVARVEVLDDDEGHAVGRRKRVQKLPASVKAAGRSANRHDRKIRAAAGGKRVLKPTRSIRLGKMRMTSRHSRFFSRSGRSKGAIAVQ